MSKIHWGKNRLSVLFLELEKSEQVERKFRRFGKQHNLTRQEWGSLIAKFNLRSNPDLLQARERRRIRAEKRKNKVTFIDDELARKALELGYDKYLESERWQNLSNAIKRKAESRCQICNGNSGGLNVHHRTYRRLLTDMEEKDLICLCRKCHTLFHNK